MIHFPPATSGDTELFGEPYRLSLLSLAANIIIIDDEAQNLALLTSMLHRSGFMGVTALTDARELPALLLSSPPDLVITDLHMPKRDGFWVLNRLAPLINGERLPVLVITGDSSRDARQQALIHGAKDFVTKPFDLIRGAAARAQPARKPPAVPGPAQAEPDAARIRHRHQPGTRVHPRRDDRAAGARR